MKNFVLLQFGAFLLLLFFFFFHWKGNLSYSSWYSQIFYSFSSIAALNMRICWTNSHSWQLPLYSGEALKQWRKAGLTFPSFCLACLHCLPQLIAISGNVIGKVNIRNLLASWRGQKPENNLAFFFFFNTSLHFPFTWLPLIYCYLNIKCSNQCLSIQISGRCFHPAAN